MSTAGELVDLSILPGMRAVYCYSRTRRPSRKVPRGWDKVPGARGCTPHSFPFWDRQEELRSLGAWVFGFSTQSTEYQGEAAKRLHLFFKLLSDLRLAFAEALKAPTFEAEGMVLIERLTLVINARNK